MSSARAGPNGRHSWSEEARRERLDALQHTLSRALPNLALPLEDPETLQGQIENFVGVIRVPVGVAGPLRVCGEAAQGAFHIPLATTEGTLVLVWCP